MKHLLLMRHAKTENGSPGQPDRARRLTERGLRDARQMGSILAEQKLALDIALVSDAQRTRETWRALSEAGHINCTLQYESSLYLASPQTCVSMARDLAHDTDAALFIGHNPGIETLIRALSQRVRDQDDLKRVGGPLKPGTLCIFELSGPWSKLSPETTELISYLTP